MYEIAALARLRLTEAEASMYASQLSDILAHVEALDAADTEGLEADADSGRVSRLRPDSPPADALQRPPADFAPAWQDGFFTVPRLAAMNGDAEESGA